MELLKSLLNKYLRKSLKDLDSDRVVEWRTKFNLLNDNYELIKSHICIQFESHRKVKGSISEFTARG